MPLYACIGVGFSCDNSARTSVLCACDLFLTSSKCWGLVWRVHGIQACRKPVGFVVNCMLHRLLSGLANTQMECMLRLSWCHSDSSYVAHPGCLHGCSLCPDGTCYQCFPCAAKMGSHTVDTFVLCTVGMAGAVVLDAHVWQMGPASVGWSLAQCNALPGHACQPLMLRLVSWIRQQRCLGCMGGRVL